MPIGSYENFTECVKQNQDKNNPDAYCGKIKHKVEDVIAPECIVKAYNHFSIKYPGMDKKELLAKSFNYLKNNNSDFEFNGFSELEGFNIGILLESMANDFDKLTLDIARRVGRPRLPGLRKGTSSARISGAKRTREGQALIKTFGTEAFEVGPKIEVLGPDKFGVPQSLHNIETGMVIQAQVIENLMGTKKQLTPLSSSNVRAAGQFNNELLVQFHSKMGQNTYRYQFANPTEAEQAYQSLLNTGSPGRWIWQNIRGHTKGETVGKSKLGPSLSPPGQGLPTIGGTIKSLVDYRVSKRAPGSRVANFDELLSQLKRSKSSPKTDPQTGSRVEKLLQERKAFREKGSSATAAGRQRAQLPKNDFVQSFRIDEIDIWIEKGHKKEFLFKLSGQDVKLDEINIIDKQGNDTRYSIIIRAFNKYKIPKGNWQIKNIFRGEGKLEIKEGKGKGWHGEPERHSKARKTGKADFPDFVYQGNIFDTNDLEIEDYKVKGYFAQRGKPPTRTFIRRHTREEGKTIKDKPRLRPLKDWEITEHNTRRLAKRFGKEKYSREIWMRELIDDLGRPFHKKIWIADNVDYQRESFGIGLANSTLKQLPLEFQDLAHIFFYKNITDDPNSTSDPEGIPAPYRRVGWTSKNKDVSAEISFLYKRIRIKAKSYDKRGSIRHEVGHAVFWWKTDLFNRWKFEEIWQKKQWHLRRQGKTGKYQANDINEFFAVQFERYYNAEFDKMFPETISFFDNLNDRVGGISKID